MKDSLVSSKGVVLTVNDLHDMWLELIKVTGLNVIGLHGEIEHIIRFINSEYGIYFLEQLNKNHVAIEYEIHAMSYLLPRSEFDEHPEWFRMDEKGIRTPDGNLCPSSKEALEIVCSNALCLSELLTPATNRYYLWADDAKSWCRCKKCSTLSASDQNLLVMNEIIRQLRRKQPDALLAYLAYLDTLEPPKAVKPDEGIFLEFAPIQRRYDARLDDKNVPENARHIEKLEALINIFGTKGAQVLEYWLDSSMFSKWTKPAKQIPFNKELFKADLLLYINKGIAYIKTFGVYLDNDYFSKYGTKEVLEYGMTLKEY